MDSIARIDSFWASAVFPGSWLWNLVLFLIPLLCLVGLRTAFLFRAYRTWITFSIRFCGFAMLMAISMLLVIIIAGHPGPVGGSNGFESATLVFVGFGFIAGGVFAYLLGRKFEPRVVEFLEKQTRRSDRLDQFTDIRTVQKEFSSQEDFDLDSEIKTAFSNDQVFLGVEQDRKPVTIERSHWRANHVQIMGPPGTGKGIQAAVILTQSLKYGDAVFVFDPKNDEWAPSVFSDACKKYNVPFHFINLREPVPQLNPLSRATPDEVAEMLYAALELGRRGTDADYYRLDDRKAARFAASLVETKDLTLLELLRQTQQTINTELLQGAKSFFAGLTEIAELNCIKTRDGLDLSAPLRAGGCVYIIGSTRNEPLIYLQKMLFVRLVQVIERSSSSKHCSIFLDEFKYLLSAATVNALGTIRDKGCNILLAHQSLGDFASCSADISEASVRTTVLDTTPIKWLYRASDWETANWISKQTGQILASAQQFSAVRNPELSETILDSRSISESQRNLFDTNTILSLPKQFAVCIGAGTPKMARIRAIKVKKSKMSINEAPLAGDDAVDLLKRVPQENIKEEQVENIHGSILEREPENRLLAFLYAETWTSLKIIKQLLADCTQAEINQLLARLEASRLIRNHKVKYGESELEEIWGISKFGMHKVLEEEQLAEERPIFYKNSVNPISMQHKLDIQTLRIASEHGGWSGWESQFHKRINKKHEIYPDAIAVRPDGVRVAIEVERTVKKESRYKSILLAHLNARKLRRWDEIYYMSPNKKISKRLKSIFLNISAVDYLGEVIELGDRHKAPFRFFTYDEDWVQNFREI